MMCHHDPNTIMSPYHTVAKVANEKYSHSSQEVTGIVDHE